MICIHHNKDLDGFTSGAIVKRKFPDCKLIGWDYGNPIPELPQSEDIVMIDISFPMAEMIRVRRRSKSLTWIDHHISAKKEFDQVLGQLTPEEHGINYVYELGIAACEIGWKYYFPNEQMPEVVKLLGEYDTWRKDDNSRWVNRILPFQYYMRTVCTSPETFPTELFDLQPDFDGSLPEIERAIETGRSILKYQEQQDMLSAARCAFEAEFEGLRGLFINQGAFSSNTLEFVYNPDKHDIMIGFQFNGRFWNVSLRSTKPEIDVSVIAKSRGGGGHKAAAGFEAKTFENIFNQQKELV